MLTNSKFSLNADRMWGFILKLSLIIGWIWPVRKKLGGQVWKEWRFIVFHWPLSPSWQFLIFNHRLSIYPHAVTLKQIYRFHYRFQSFPHHHSLTRSFFSSTLSLSLLCAAVAGCPGIWGPGGGSGVQGPWKPSSAGQMVPPGRGDPGLSWFSYSPEKWDIPLSAY